MGSDQRGHDVGGQPRHQHLCLRVAEARVIFDKLRPAVGQHQACEQNTFERCAARFHGGDRRIDDLAHHAINKRRRQHSSG